MDSLVSEAHNVLAELPEYTSPLAQELPSDGVYFYYEDGETADCNGKTLQRIVRIGSHFKDKGLVRRLIDHYWENKDGSVFRKHIGSALICRDGKPEEYLRLWMATGEEYDITLEAEVDSQLRKRFKFRVIYVPDPSERAFVERNAIRFFSAAQHSTDDWLGKFSPYAEIRDSGVWNVDHVSEPLEEPPEAFVARLGRLVMNTIEKPKTRAELNKAWRWSYVNQALRTIVSKRVKEPFRTNSLKLLFDETQDGWVALRLARELRLQSKFDEALKFAAKAENLMPIPSRKVEARQEIDSIRLAIKRSETSETSETPDLLVIVGCTRRKIWSLRKDAERYVPAKDAYVGDNFKQWIEKDINNPKLTVKGFRWIILSGKYGFIEPEHPISDYDVNLNNPAHGPMSKESLTGQAHKQPRFDDKLLLNEFKEIVVHASDSYLQVVREIFPERAIRSWEQFASS